MFRIKLIHIYFTFKNDDDENYIRKIKNFFYLIRISNMKVSVVCMKFVCAIPIHVFQREIKVYSIFLIFNEYLIIGRTISQIVISYRPIESCFRMQYCIYLCNDLWAIYLNYYVQSKHFRCTFRQTYCCICRLFQFPLNLFIQFKMVC